MNRGKFESALNLIALFRSRRRGAKDRGSPREGQRRSEGEGEGGGGKIFPVPPPDRIFRSGFNCSLAAGDRSFRNISGWR